MSYFATVADNARRTIRALRRLLRSRDAGGSVRDYGECAKHGFGMIGHRIEEWEWD
jgi:hypothetical protein